MRRHKNALWPGRLSDVSLYKRQPLGSALMEAPAAKPPFPPKPPCTGKRPPDAAPPLPTFSPVRPAPWKIGFRTRPFYGLCTGKNGLSAFPVPGRIGTLPAAGAGGLLQEGAGFVQMRAQAFADGLARAVEEGVEAR